MKNILSFPLSQIANPFFYISIALISGIGRFVCGMKTFETLFYVEVASLAVISIISLVLYVRSKDNNHGWTKALNIIALLASLGINLVCIAIFFLFKIAI